VAFVVSIVAPMKIATWNVNSLRVRLPQVLDWLAEARPDVLAVQETKVADEEFPVMELQAAGYHTLYTGEKGYNGVALIARKRIERPVLTALPGIADPARRFVAAEIGGVHVVNVYVPNGKAVGSEAYDYKLQWLECLRSHLAGMLAQHRHVVVLGDFNVAPEDRDVYDPVLWANTVLFSGPERAAFHRLLELGLVDVVRERNGDAVIYTWWDYRFYAFRRNRGLRIDHILASPAMARRCVSAGVDTRPRGLERPSDHAPLFAEFTASR